MAGQNFMREYGARLRENGYSIIPIRPGSKVPGSYSNGVWTNLSGWNTHADQPATPCVVQTWTSWPDCSIGIMCGKAPGQEIGLAPIDIDILDPILAGRVTAIFVKHLGETPAVRIGMSPKIMLIYATKETFSKIAKGPIECLAHGQQFVAYGIHEKTGQPYTWPMESLADIHISQLPLVTAEQLWAALDEAYDILPDDMKTGRLGAPRKLADNVVVFTGGHQANDELQGTPEACREFIDRIPNPNLIWDDWNRIGMALWGASGGQQWGYELFNEFSSRSAKYDPRETGNRWQSYNKSPPNRIGFGTLHHLAMQNDDTPIPAEINFNEAKKQAVDFDISGILDSSSRRCAETPAATSVETRNVLQDTFPTEWIHTNSLVGEVVRYIVGTVMDKHPALALGNALALFGALFGRRYFLDSPFFPKTRCNIYAVGIAPTGAGKDHSRRCVEAIIDACGLAQFMGGEDFTSDAAIRTMIAQHPSRLCQVDEIGELLKDILGKAASGPKRTIVSALLTLYSTDISRGKQYAIQTKDFPRTDLRSPNLNIYATTTPRNLMASLSRSTVENGLLNRILFFPVFGGLQPFVLREVDRKVPSTIVAAIQEAMAIIPEGAGNLNCIQQAEIAPTMIPVLANGAEQALSDIVNEQKAKTGADRFIWARLAEYTIKIAMIEAIARDPVHPVITTDIVGMAARLARWCLDYAEQLISAEMFDNDVEERFNRLLKICKSAGFPGITLSEVVNKTADMNSQQRADGLKCLHDAEKVFFKEQRRGARGPAARVYFAADYVTSDEKARAQHGKILALDPSAEPDPAAVRDAHS